MLYDKLKNYSENGIYPFHMPGHKRNIADKNLPYNIDLTEINGFDNLHDANGCIKDIEIKAAELYSVNNAFLLINGATGGILATIRALINFGDKVIISRNCHKSVYNAIELCGLNAEYILPEKSPKYGICTSVSPQKLENLILKNPDTKLVVITSPTYEGVVSDIKNISAICHKYGVKLFVDEAHGAHFPFSDQFPCEAVKCGADVAVLSLHKTLPSLTQTALLLTNDDSLSDKLRDNLSVFETSSPSYVLMSSIEKCLDFISDNKFEFNKYIERLKKFYHKAEQFSNLKILYCDKKFKETCFDYDIGKIVISTQGTDLNGTQLAEILRNNYKIETEMAYTDYVIAMTSVCDTDEGFYRLHNALSEIDKNCKKSLNIKNNFNNEIIPQKKFNSFEKFRYKKAKTRFEHSKGRVSLEYIWAYPPGIPLIVPGEIISKELINYINILIEKDVEVYSSEKNLPDFISVTEI